MLRPAPKISCCKSYWQKISPLFIALLLNRWLPLLSYLHSSVALWWHVHCRPSLQVKTPWSTCLTYGAQTLFAKDFYLSTDAQMRAKINNLGFFSKAQVWKAPLFPRGSVIPKQMHIEEEMSELKEPNKNDWGPSKILNGFWKIPLTRPDFRLSDSYYSIFVIFISLAHWILSRHEKKNAAGSISCWSSQTYCKCRSSPRGINQRAIRVYCKQLINKDCYHLIFWTLVSQSV